MCFNSMSHIFFSLLFTAGGEWEDLQWLDGPADPTKEWIHAAQDDQGGTPACGYMPGGFGHGVDAAIHQWYNKINASHQGQGSLPPPVLSPFSNHRSSPRTCLPRDGRCRPTYSTTSTRNTKTSRGMGVSHPNVRKARGNQERRYNIFAQHSQHPTAESHHIT